MPARVSPSQRTLRASPSATTVTISLLMEVSCTLVNGLRPNMTGLSIAMCTAVGACPCCCAYCQQMRGVCVCVCVCVCVFISCARNNLHQSVSFGFKERCLAPEGVLFRAERAGRDVASHTQPSEVPSIERQIRDPCRDRDSCQTVKNRYYT